MPLTAAAIMAAGSIGSGIFGFFGSQNASAQQTAALNAALAQQRQFFNVTQSNLQPFIGTGGAAAGTLSSLLTPGADVSNLLASVPGEKYLQSFGQQAVQNQGTTLGLGGNTLTAGADYATNLGLNTAFSPILTSLLGLSNVGAGAAGNLASAAGNFGQTIGNTLGGIGQAQAAGTLGSFNALGNASQGIGNSFLLSQLLNKTQASNAPPPGIYSNPAFAFNAPNPWANPQQYGNA